jgi:hypothetical protein
MSKHITSDFKPFTLGQPVWLEAKNLRLSYPSKKIAPKCHGSFKVKQVLTPRTYKLDLPKSWKIHPIFHASLLTPYHENEIHRPSESQPPPDAVKDEEQYEIEGIINHRTRDNETQYLIKWKGYSHMENEWLHEELEWHAEELVNKYRTPNNTPKIEPPIKPKKRKRRKART